LNLSYKALAVICSVAVSFVSGCGSEHTSSYSSDKVPPLFSQGAQQPAAAPQQAEQADFIPASDAACSISFAEAQIGVRGEGVQIQGKSAVISSGGVYSVSGSCSDGKLLISSSEPVSLILSGLTLKSADGAAIECSESAPLMLTISTDNIINGIEATGAVTINGSGSLEISDCGTAISCDVLKLCGAALDIRASGDAIVTGGCVISAAGSAAVRSSGDGIRTDGHLSLTDGTLDITSAQDGIHAVEAVYVSGGALSVTSGGGSSAVKLMRSRTGGHYGRHGGYSTNSSDRFDFSDLVSGDGRPVASKKGIRSDGNIVIGGGTVTVSSADDSISARGSAAFAGGTVKLTTGDDAISALYGVTIDGGTLDVKASYTAIEALNISVSGGSSSLHSFNDGICAAGSIQGADPDITDRYVSISDGTLTINAGGSGISSEGTLAVSGGDITVFSSEDSSGGALAYGDSFAISGGSLAAFGPAEDAMAPTLVTGPCISLYASAQANSTIQLTDSVGTVLLDVTLPEACSCVIISSEALRVGEAYTLLCNGTPLTSVTAADGICGGGPDGRDGGIYNDIDDTSDGIAA